MAVFKISEFKEDGTKRTKEELNKIIGKEKKYWYYFCYYKNNDNILKSRHSKQFKTKKEAEIAEREFLAKCGKLNTKTMYFKTFVTYYFECAIKRESSLYDEEKSVYTHIVPFFENNTVQDFEANTLLIKNWKSDIEKKAKSNGEAYSIKYKRKLYSFLKNILDLAVEEQLIEINPTILVKTFKEVNDKIIKNEKIKYQKPSQFNIFISVVDELEWKAFFSFLYWMGIRKGEQQALTWNDIHFEDNLVDIFVNLSVKVRDKTKKKKTGNIILDKLNYKLTATKNSKRRRIAMPDELYPIMVDLYKMQSSLPGFSKDWFVFGGIRFLAQTTIDNKFEKYYDLVDKKYGIISNRLSHKEFGRHSHASLLRSLGVDWQTIADRLGDTVEVVKSTYAHLFDEKQKSILTILNRENIKNLDKNF